MHYGLNDCMSFISENDWSNLLWTRQTFNYLVSYSNFQYFYNTIIYILYVTCKQLVYGA